MTHPSPYSDRLMAPSGWNPISLDTMLLAWALAEPNEWGKECPDDELCRKAEAGASLTTEEEW